MNDELDRLFARIQTLEDTIERRLDANRAQFKYRRANGKAVFETEIRQAHRRRRIGIRQYLHGRHIRDTTSASHTAAPKLIAYALEDLRAKLR
jgi:hypothetical protein